MKSDLPLSYIRSRLSRYGAILAFLLLATATVETPIQKWISIGRYQHWGIGLFLVGLGFFVQTIAGWNHLPRWERISHIASGLYICSIGVIFYANPWLDYSMAIQTQSTESLRMVLLCSVAFLSFLVLLVLLKAMHEERKLTIQRQTAPHDNS